MCKHVAAVLYGVGARLDEQPELLFTLRQVDAQEMIAQAGDGLREAGKKGAPAGRILRGSNLAELFGLDMADAAPAPRPAPQAGGETAKRPRRRKAPESPERLASDLPRNGDRVASHDCARPRLPSGDHRAGYESRPPRAYISACRRA